MCVPTQVAFRFVTNNSRGFTFISCCSFYRGTNNVILFNSKEQNEDKKICVLLCLFSGPKAMILNDFFYFNLNDCYVLI